MSNATSSTSIPPPNAFSRFHLPGLNLPLNWEPHGPYSKWKENKVVQYAASGEGKDLFRTALNENDMWEGYTSLRLTPLREFTMLHIMDVITDKPGWEEKVFDYETAEKWKTEAMATKGRDVTREMADWVIAELRFKAETFKAVGAVSAYDGDVVKSDISVPTDLKEALQAAVKDLEEVPMSSKDYHPGSDGKVLDLVHPSLFPLIYGRTRVVTNSLIGLDECIRSCGKGEVVRIRADETQILNRRESYHRQNLRPAYSKDFQWIPSEVEFSPDGSAKFTSYINNLHPLKYKNLYSIIEKIIDRAIPLWNMTLFPLQGKLHGKYRLCRIPYSTQEFEPDPDRMAPEDTPQQEEDEQEDAYWERRDQWARDIRRVVLPNPGEFKPPPPIDAADMMDIKRDYAHRGLQVVVKLANIELTPEKPTYEGGTWHVEGQMNEHICATALYYLSNSNITSSRLAFRQQSSYDDANDIGYAQDEHDFLSAVFGCENNEPAVQEVGSVECSEGRLLTFPNILQHRVLPFGLADPTKPGHRKILALFLIDPNIRIISTANVPPQQRDWWADAVLEDFARHKRTDAFGKLSQEISDKIFESVDDFPIGMDEAKEIRLKLMEERRLYVIDANRSFEGSEFSLCEH